MSFWKPVSISDDVQETIDKRVILSKAKESLEKDLSKVENKIDKQKENDLDPFKFSKRKIMRQRMKYDSLCEERDVIKRRIDIINKELEQVIK